MADAARGQVRRGPKWPESLINQETAGERSLSGVGGEVEESDFRGSGRPESGETESEDGGHGNFPREIGLGREEGSWRSSCREKKKHFLPSSFNGRTSLSLFKYWWEEARREREQRYHKGRKKQKAWFPKWRGALQAGGGTPHHCNKGTGKE